MIPLFNNVDHIKESILSVRNQVFKNWECFIIDDNSTDGSLQLHEILLEMDLVLYRTKISIDNGAIIDSNIGFNMITSSYVVFMNDRKIMGNKLSVKKFVFFLVFQFRRGFSYKGVTIYIHL